MNLLSILASDSIAVPLAASFPASEVKYILDNSTACMFLSSTKFENEKAKKVFQQGFDQQIQQHIVHKKPPKEDPSQRVELVDLEKDSQGGLMLYTSGTTSRPVS